MLAGCDARISAGISLYQGTPPDWGCVDSGRKPPHRLVRKTGKQLASGQWASPRHRAEQNPGLLGPGRDSLSGLQLPASSRPGETISSPRPLWVCRPRPRSPAPPRQGLAVGPAFPRVRTASPRRLSTASSPPLHRKLPTSRLPRTLGTARALRAAGRVTLRRTQSSLPERSGLSVVEAAYASSQSRSPRPAQKDT